MNDVIAAAILHNTATDRYHPILFRDAPLPGNPAHLRRLKSIGHHTEGFTSHEAAAASLDDDRIAGAVLERSPGKLIPWDGDDLPAMVCFLDGQHLVFI